MLPLDFGFKDHKLIALWFYLLSQTDDYIEFSSANVIGELGITRQEFRSRLGVLDGLGLIRIEGNNQRNNQENNQQPTKKITKVWLCQSASYKKVQPTKKPTANQENNHQNNQQNGIDFERFKEFFNSTVGGSTIPTITRITKARQGVLNARLDEYGKNALAEVVTKASKSKFLTGDNNHGFIANFDWIFKPTNFRKILEGNYDNR